MRDELAFALELADEADALALRGFSRSPGPSPGREAFTKADGTLVTETDRLIEATLRERIAARFPEHSVFGEEGGGPAAAAGSGAPCWIIDPIDGTNNFAWGIPIFGSLIALAVDGEVAVGVASAPALGERYWAALGERAFMNGSPISVSTVPSVSEGRLVFATWEEWVQAGLAGAWGDLLARCKRSRGFGDFWAHMLVARGAADAMAEPELELWDVAALIPIVTEAGGRITDFAGQPLRAVPGKTSCLTTNGRLHAEILQGIGTGSAVGHTEASAPID
ncbi:MAG TPA: inositol monophosphatase family protein [Actinomycetota bacterium]|nr:inositol monophosphatase family protein [Actinomycetota bacterium]